MLSLYGTGNWCIYGAKIAVAANWKSVRHT